MFFQPLEKTVDPVLTNIIENDGWYSDNSVIFQQDGDPTHYAQSFGSIWKLHFQVSGREKEMILIALHDSHIYVPYITFSGVT